MKPSRFFCILFTITIILFSMSGVTLAEELWEYDPTEDLIWTDSDVYVGGQLGVGPYLDILSVHWGAAGPYTVFKSGLDDQVSYYCQWYGGHYFGTGILGDTGDIEDLEYGLIMHRDVNISITDMLVVGNLGIGTAQPAAIDSRLQVNSQAIEGAGTVSVTGNVVTGTGTHFLSDLQKGSDIYIEISSEENFISIVDEIRSDTELTTIASYDESAVDKLYAYTQNFFCVNENGNVGIGTADPQSMLDIKGRISSTELAVDGEIMTRGITVTKADWADFVFDESYNLRPLNAVESYIKENNHLPDIPSEQQVQNEGFGIPEMMAKQMQKIEELTLYLIELKKENEAMKERLSALETQRN